MQNILSPTHNGYSDAAQAAKQGAHRSTASLLRKVAAALGLAPGSYDIRSNEAGIAVPGEVILHGETIYIQVGGLGLGVLVRSCKGAPRLFRRA